MTELLVPDQVIDSIRTYIRRTSRGAEQGGLLLGYRKPGAIELHSATFPGPWDHGTMTLFRRSERGHRVRALREWVRSNRTVDWVGEWHTHPGGIAKPSFIDRRSWASLAKHTGKPMAFIIFADHQTYYGMQATHGRKTTDLTIVERDSSATLYG